MIKNIMKINKKIWIGVLFVLAFLCFNITLVSFNSSSVSAGSIIKKNSNSPGGGGGGGGDCDSNSNLYRIDCAGASWMYFKWTGNRYTRPITYGKGTYDYLWNDDSEKVEIPVECQDTGGFWHYGINRKWTKNNPATNVGSNMGGKKGYWGHWLTLSYGVKGWVKTVQKTQVSQTILASDKETVLYTAKNRSTSDLLKDYRAALVEDYKQEHGGKEPSAAEMRRINGIDTIEEMDAGVYMFCAWSTPTPEWSLDVVLVNIVDGDEGEPISIDGAKKGYNRIKSQDIISSLQGDDGVSDVKFIGWKTSRSSGLKNILSNTTATTEGGAYVGNRAAENVIYYKDGEAQTIYRDIYVALTDAKPKKTVYAYYVPRYFLKRKPGDGTSIVVKRPGGTYAIHKGSLSDGDGKIYPNDKLSICVEVSSEYTLTDFLIYEGDDDDSPTNVLNKRDDKGCVSYTVVDDTTIVTETKPVESYVLNSVPVNGSGTKLGVCGDRAVAEENKSATVSLQCGDPVYADLDKDGVNAKYYFTGCWRVANRKDESECVNKSKPFYEVKKMTGNVTVYPVYEPKFTLWSIPVDDDGAQLKVGESSASVLRGGSATVRTTETLIKPADLKTYTFAGCWREHPKDKTECLNVGESSFTVEEMRRDKKIYPVYDYSVENAWLRIYAVTRDDFVNSSSGVKKCKLISDPIEMVHAAGEKGSKVSANAHGSGEYETSEGEKQYWDFEGISLTRDAPCTPSQTSRTYTVNPLTQNTKVYAVYHWPKLKINSIPVDEDGNILSNISGNAVVAKKGMSASVKANTATGYMFTGNWRVGSNKASNTYYGDTYTETKIGVSPAWSSTELSNKIESEGVSGQRNVYPVYRRYSFTGKAEVSSTSSNNTSTGWVDANKTVTLEIGCENDGCTANFKLGLKDMSDAGVVSYQAYRGGSKITTKPTSPADISTSGTEITYNNKSTYSEKITPGQQFCYKVTFTPMGSHSNSDLATAEACAKAEVSTFEGKSNVSGSSNDATTGWTNKNKKATLNINNCSPTSGCNASFSHQLKRTKGIGRTDYTITRTSNYWVSTKSLGVKPESDFKSGNFGSNTETVVSSSGPFKLYPGVVVCERMKFKVTNDTDSYTTTTACASALGKAQPPDPDDPNNPGNPGDPNDPNDPTKSSAFLNIKVRGTSDGANTSSKTYQNAIYVKPTNKVQFRATYNPVLQYTYYLYPQKMRINGGTIYPTGAVNSSSTLGQLFNTNYANCKSKSECWNNAYALSSSFSNSFTYNLGYTLGDTTYQTEEMDEYSVLASQVGSDLTETAKTNTTTNKKKDGTTFNNKATPTQAEFASDSDNNNTGNVSISSIESKAHVYVPYNFDTGIEITTPSSTLIHPGESASISYKIDIKKRRNNTTTNGESGTEYATVARSTTRKLIVYSGDSKNGTGSFGGSLDDDLCSYFGLSNDEVNCGYASSVSGGTLNSSGNLSGYTHSFSASFYTKDIVAGSEVCVAAAVYPSNSGAETNWNDREGNHKWRISNSVCYTVAKRPSFQVWGGNIYSTGNITTGVSVKKHLAGYTDYKVNGGTGPNYVFGSWGELAIVASGSVRGLSSGAGTGFSENVNGTLWPNEHPSNGRGNNANINGKASGGSNEPSLNFCLRSTLSIANATCSSGYVGGMGTSSSVMTNAERSKASILQAFVNTNPTSVNVSGEVNLNQEDKKMENGVYYYRGDSDLTVKGGTVQKGTTQVVHSDKNIVINGDIRYASGLGTLGDVPKLVIYAKNVIVNCDVSRVDAVLIADSKVITCNSTFTDSGDDTKINDADHSNQLLINGAIITNSLTLNRTYGAATGANSMVPAEIVNFDSTLYLWGEVEDESNDTGKLTTTYIHELSPRY